MQFLNKILFLASAILSLIFSANNIFAQFPGMGAVRAQQSAQFANQQMMMQMNMVNGWTAGAGQGKKYQVTFKDSTVKDVVSFIYADTILHKSFLLFVNKKFPKSDTLHRFQKIYTDQTLYISTIIDHASGQEIFGVPTDSCWMFKVIDGPLAVYAKSLDYLNTTVVMFVADNEFTPSAIVGIQLNDGPIEKYTKENLIKMMGQDADALEFIDKKKYYKAVKKYNQHAEKAEKNKHQ
jgi:hypothetical protein